MPGTEPAHAPLNADRNRYIFEVLAHGIELEGWAVLPHALPDSLCQVLMNRVHVLNAADFRPARVGRRTGKRPNTTVRRDRIRWINREDPAETAWLDWMEALRLYLNQQLILGLFHFESHFARYAPGAFYRRHLDAFRGDANRVISCVAYLNADWSPDDGGDLLLYGREDATQQTIARVVPELGTLAVFLSEEFPHEVLPAARTRYSIAGWFRVNDLLQASALTEPFRS